MSEAGKMTAVELGTALHKLIEVAQALPYVVECLPAGRTLYEPVAAFNVRRVALAYARDCKEANMANEYRVGEEVLY